VSNNTKDGKIVTSKIIHLIIRHIGQKGIFFLMNFGKMFVHLNT